MSTPVPLHRRGLLQWAALLLSASSPAAFAQRGGPTPDPLLQVGLFSLLGDTIQITLADNPAEPRAERNPSETMDGRDLGLDQVALRGLRSTMARLQPQAQVHMFRATPAIALPEQRQIADGAQRAELPDWFVRLIAKHNLSHLLLLTRHRGAALLRTEDGEATGRGTVEGIGFYIDPLIETVNRLTQIRMRGGLGAYVDMRLQLMEVSSGRILAQQHIRDGVMYSARTDAQSLQPWNVLEPREKVDILRRMVEDSVGEALPHLLREAGYRV